MNGAFGDAIDPTKLYPFQLSLFDELENGEGVDLENAGHLLRGEKLFDH